MKRSEFGKAVRLVRACLDEERMWSQAEIMLEKARDARKDRYAADTNGSRGASLEEFRKQISGCTNCPLGATRQRFVFGTGNPEARLMFIGEGPGYDEDRQGEPFVGRAGQLLDKIIESIGMKRREVYIANVVKCHPMKDPSNPEKHGNDRPPTPEEMNACLAYLEKQISIIKPKLICTLGSTATRAILKTEAGISVLRGKFFDYNGIMLIPTYHPAALLRNPSLKKDVWEDMKQIRSRLQNDTVP